MNNGFDVEFDDYYFPDGPKKYPQWVIANRSKIPMYSPGFQQPLRKASPSDPSTWMSYEVAVNLCEMNEGYLPGFVLTDQDPFTVIDMDVHEGQTPQEAVTWYEAVAERSGTYVERTSGGLGLHIWILGNYGAGKRSSQTGLERYSQERFILCTGNVIHNLPITEGNGVAEYIAPYLDEKLRTVEVIEDQPQVKSDEDVIDDILDWSNASKFSALMYASYADLVPGYYPSGSEADGALINFLVKASPNNAQVKRIFRTSALAQRGPKAGQKDKIMYDDKYLDRTIANFRSYIQAEERQKRAQSEALIEQSRANIEAMMLSSQKDQISVKQQIAVSEQIYELETAEYEFPPGIIGEIAKWIHVNAIHPILQVSVTTALAAATALTGKGWVFRQKYLSAFYMIAAPSGSGKNTLHKALGKIATILEEKGCAGNTLIDSSRMRSEAAWRKNLIEKVSYLQLYREFAEFLENINNENVGGANHGILGFILDAYSSAHVGAVSGGMQYRRSEENIEGSNTELTLSIIGECVLDDMLESLTGKLSKKGFLSRFNFGVYEKARPPRNKEALEREIPLADWIIETMCYLAKRQRELVVANEYINVTATPEAEATLDELYDFVESKIQQCDPNDETLLQIWVRVCERVERMVGTFAVMANPEAPVIEQDQAEWAIKFVMSNVDFLLQRHKSGEVGEMTGEKIRKIVARAILRYFAADLANSHAEMRYIPHQKLKIFLKGPIQSRCYGQLKRVETTRRREDVSRVFSRVLYDFTSEGLIVPLTEADKRVLAEEKPNKISIKIANSADAWFIHDLDRLAEICGIDKE